MVTYFGDFAEDDTVNIPFNTFDSNDPSNSVTATDLVDADIFVHKDGSATPIVTDGATIDIDAPGVGAHMITIDTSADAAYSTGSEYSVRINGVTVDSGTINAWVGSFSIERAGGALAVALLIPTTTMRGTDSANTTTPPTVAAIADGVWDELLTGAAHNIATSAGRRLRGIQEFQGYELGAVYVDTNNGTAGTTNFENGTVENPVDSIADARTIADSVGLVNFSIRPGSSITLAQTFNGFSFQGVGATINLGSQDVAGCRFISANVTGTGTGASPIILRDCIVTGAFSVDRATLLGCNLSTSSFALTAAGKYVFDHCFSGDVEGVSQIIDFTTGVGESGDVVFRHWSGCLDIRNMGQSGTDSLIVEGLGDVVFNVNCTGGTATLGGALVLTNNGSTTVTQTGELVSQIAAVKAETVSILADTNELQGDDVPALVAALNDLSSANILTEVNAALDTAIVELGVAAPTATPTVRTGLMLLYMALRNLRATTATADIITNDAGTTIASATVSDDAVTFTKTEYS